MNSGPICAGQGGNSMLLYPRQGHANEHYVYVKTETEPDLGGSSWFPPGSCIDSCSVGGSKEPGWGPRQLMAAAMRVRVPDLTVLNPAELCRAEPRCEAPTERSIVLTKAAVPLLCQPPNCVAGTTTQPAS